MHTGPDLRNRLRSRRADGARHWAPSASLLVPLVVVVALLAMIPVAVTSLLVAGGAIGLVGLIIMVSALGADKASNVLMVLAFGFAPLTSFSLGLKPFVLASLFFFLAVALVLPRLVRQPLRLPSTLLVGTLLFTVMGLVSVPLAISAIESTIYVATAVIALFAMPAVIVWMRPTHRARPQGQARKGPAP